LPGQTKVEGFDPRCRPWYMNAIKQTDQVVLNEPYFSLDCSEVFVTVSKAIEDKNKNIYGVVGIDLDTNLIEEDFQSRFGNHEVIKDYHVVLAKSNVVK
jgi:methyl-accepting chemotaxis protein